MSIKGIPVTLYETTITGQDDFGRDIVEEKAVVIDNVVVGSLVGQQGSDDVVSETSLNGRHAAYNLALPADDSHEWENKCVEFYGRRWKVVGVPTKFIDGFMGQSWPWNKQVRVEAYE